MPSGGGRAGCAAHGRYPSDCRPHSLWVVGVRFILMLAHAFSYVCWTRVYERLRVFTSVCGLSELHSCGLCDGLQLGPCRRRLSRTSAGREFMRVYKRFHVVSPAMHAVCVMGCS